MITVACVYRSGGDFTVDDVARLVGGIRRYVPSDYRIVCLTDQPEDVRPFVEPVPLQFDWPGWWAKIELFTLPGPVLYFDLDTVLCGPINDLCEWVATPSDIVVMLRGFYRSDVCSGIMAWNRDLSGLTRQFGCLAAKASWVPLTHGLGCGRYNGDQEFIREQLAEARVPIVLAQDIQLGIYSYKVHVKPLGRIPADASVICFHGNPRPWDVDLTTCQERF